MRFVFTQLDRPADHVLWALEQKGWQPQYGPFRACRLVKGPPPQGSFDLLVLTSKQAVKWLDKYGRSLIDVPIACVGAATSAKIQPHRLIFPSPPANGAELVSRLRKTFAPETSILFLRGETVHPSVPEGLKDFSMLSLVVYYTEELEPPLIEQPSLVYFQAPSTVDDYFAHNPQRPNYVAAIGPSTAAALEKLGWAVDFQPTRPETAAVVDEMPTPIELHEAIEQKQQKMVSQ